MIRERMMQTSGNATIEVRVAQLEKHSDGNVSKDRFEEFATAVLRELARINAKLDAGP